jgi:hypothetical protein
MYLPYHIHIKAIASTETRVGRREKTKTSLEERGAKRRRDG